MIVIVDYGMGNLRSVRESAYFLGKDLRITDSAPSIKKAKKLIFPGVGNFGEAVRQLKKRNIFTLLRERIKEGLPFLGICLGMQLLFEESEEAGGVKGLGVLEGRVKRFRDKDLIVPHMGWNQIRLQATGYRLQKSIFKGIGEGSYFYFAHSYYCAPKNKGVTLTTTTYGIEFASSLSWQNIWGVQFHPEKSQNLGLKVFKNFLKLC